MKPRRIATLFLLQLEFLRTRMKDLKEALPKNAVMDRSVYEDPYFAQKIFEEGRISELELQIYLSLFKEMMEEIPGTPSKKPDVLIYLKASWPTVYAHLMKRGREYELGEASMKHLQFLHAGYDDWLKTAITRAPSSSSITIKAEFFDDLAKERESLGSIKRNLCKRPSDCPSKRSKLW
jgi:deoxyadenosine/deoxycytidine kinase